MGEGGQRYKVPGIRLIISRAVIEHIMVTIVNKSVLYI